MSLTIEPVEFFTSQVHLFPGESFVMLDSLVYDSDGIRSISRVYIKFVGWGLSWSLILVTEVAGPLLFDDSGSIWKQLGPPSLFNKVTLSAVPKASLNEYIGIFISEISSVIQRTH